MFLARLDFRKECRWFTWLSCLKPIWEVSWLTIILGAPTFAAERYWIDTGGGPFNDTMNWSATSGGAGGASIPGISDIANFTLASSYTVTFPGSYTNNNLDIENGTVTLDFGGATYTLHGTGAVDIGNIAGQTGRLTIQDGSLAVDISNNAVTLGYVATSSGYLIVADGGRIGNSSFRPNATVGWYGTGNLSIVGTGRMDVERLALGYWGASSGTASIAGGNAIVNVLADTIVGNFGAGSMSIDNGGTLLTAGDSYLGYFMTGDGSASVSGAGSYWSSGNHVIGNQGDGSLRVSSGAHVSSVAGYVGNTSTGIGSATVTGTDSRWDLSSELIVGREGPGNLTVASGGRTVSKTAILGDAVGSEGRVTITGASSKWEIGGDVLDGLTVGNSGIGDVAILSGGELYASRLTLGKNAGAAGEIRLTGSGSRLALSGNMIVGEGGNGTMAVADDSTLYVAGNGIIGNAPGEPIGTLSLDGGDVYVGGDFSNSGVFNFSDGLLQVAGDFQPNPSAAAFTIDGSFYDDLPTLVLVGSLGSSTNHNITLLTVGQQLRGQLLLQEGRQLNLVGGNVYIGRLPGSEGSITLASGAELRTTGNLAIGGSAVSAGGAGTLEIDGGTVDVGTFFLHRDGIITLRSGTLRVDSVPVLAGDFNWTGGLLQFDSDTTLTDTNASVILGGDQIITGGRTLAVSTGATLTLSTPVIVEGGTVVTGALNARSNLDLRTGVIMANGALTNSGSVHLGGPLALLSGVISNAGTIEGTGTIGGTFTNELTGRLEVMPGDRLVLTSTANTNSGQVSVIGGLLQVDGPFANQSTTGIVSARDASLRFIAFTNNGLMAFGSGTVDVYGDITQNAGGRIVVSNGGIVNFHDDVILSSGASSVQVSALGSTISQVVFWGDYNGGAIGTGQVYIEGNHRPGNSPALVNFGGDLAYGPYSTLELELGGKDRGGNFDALDVNGSVTVDGTLKVVLTNSFNFLSGDEFVVIAADQGITGKFDKVLLPDLGAILGLEILYDSTFIKLAVVPAFAGDYNDDRAIDAADYVLWRNTLGTTVSPGYGADGNRDGVITTADYGIWRSHFYGGSPPGSGSVINDNTPIPEPTAASLLLIFGVIGCCWRQSQTN